ncbi:nucleoside triphosphate pyrophosphohydrolase [Pseudogracilibacillus sp. SE30717A]|uniref:nucleoside triphosphate pyrophosphohydrolase n=1 Tax=Pseudogracilibacillus sp. SE30717A TaxID=3098293 RepID=UPI00300DCA7C
MEKEIKIIGLGAGDIEQLPLGIYRMLTRKDLPIFTRTMDHPVIKTLEDEGVTLYGFDSYYEESDDFQTVYQRIVNKLLTEAKEKSLIYAVPGHPMLAEKTVQLLLNQKDIDIQIIGGQSYLDDLFTTLKIDPIDGFQFLDATSFEREEITYRNHLIFCQVYDKFIASEVKLTLLEDLPPDYTVYVVEAAGSVDERVLEITVEDLDRTVEVSNLTSLYIPPIQDEQLPHQFQTLRSIIKKLRGPEGCPWDKKQTHETLREYAVEEVYELIDAINREDDEGMIEELGDVLLQVMLHSQIGEDEGYFSIDDVIKGITEKMIHRHPHVFNEQKTNKSWDELKEEEKRDGKDHFLLDSVIRHAPALQVAYKLQKKAAKVGFDWTDVREVWKKLDEELREFNEAISQEDHEEMEKELGDILFVLANIARFYKINPELALNRTNEKFIFRFNDIERQVRKSGKKLEQMTLEQMDKYWDLAKKKE